MSTACHNQNTLGEEASYVHKKLIRINEKQQDSASSTKGFLKDTILDVFSECLSKGWDGYDAEPLSKKVVQESLKFIEILPLDIDMPEIIPEPSGDLCLLWQRSGAFVLSLSITPNENISYAFIFGKSEGCGHLQFFDEIPEILMGMIRKVQRG